MSLAPNTLPEGAKLILIYLLNLKLIQEQKKYYRWNRPKKCPKCFSSRLWGHGFVQRYFIGYESALWMKRWLCADCRSVHTARPFQYPPGFQYPKKTIYNAIENRLQNKTYLQESSYQLQQYWLKALKFQSQLKNSWTNLKHYFSESKKQKKFKVTFRLKYREIPCSKDPPHLLFAVKTR